MGGYPSGAPGRVPVADVITVAKRDLRAGETLDGSGGATVYGLIERAEVARAEQLLPLGLADGVTVREVVPQGRPITYGMVVPDQHSVAYRLRREQDALW